MSYTKPVGVAPLSIGSVLGYAKPVGVAPLHLGHVDGLDRTGTIAGTMATPTGLIYGGALRQAVIAGVMATPTGVLQGGALRQAVIAGVMAAPTGGLQGAFDANLLNSLGAGFVSGWQLGTAIPASIQQPMRLPPIVPANTVAVWQDGETAAVGASIPYQDAALSPSGQTAVWQDGEALGHGETAIWEDAGPLGIVAETTWQEARPLRTSAESAWESPPLLANAPRSSWQDGEKLAGDVRQEHEDGQLASAGVVVVWQDAELVWNAPNPQKDAIPAPWRPPWGTALHLRCPLPGTRLSLGRTPCVLIAEREIPIQRSYMSVNSASLVRWPDLTPLPVTSMTIETDFDSWCWALSASLFGADAWNLVQPNPLACEVLATINGQEWRFLLDAPNRSAAFNNHRVSIKGRSRSAWLHNPFTPNTDRSETNAREMQQIAEAALDGTGWTLDWQLENWVVPAGRYTSFNTPIGTLIRLVNATNDGLYTDPTLQVISAVKRWPVASWLLDGETVDLLIPEDVVISLTQSPLYTPAINGVYVSGTSHGALALVKVAGTDGATQPDQPIVDELLCDTAGVAARQRGLNALSDSGAGFTMDAETLFTPEIGLVRPGLIVSIAGMKGMARSCRISAQWSSGLQVKQSVGLERRESA